MALGIWHGICCFVIPVRVLSGVNDAGRHTNVYGMGTAVMTAVVITVTLRVSDAMDAGGDTGCDCNHWVVLQVEVVHVCVCGGGGAAMC
jgi:hypothetical protein